MRWVRRNGDSKPEIWSPIHWYSVYGILPFQFDDQLGEDAENQRLQTEQAGARLSRYPRLLECAPARAV